MASTPYRIYSENNIELAGQSGSVQIDLPVSFNHSSNSFLKDLTDLKNTSMTTGHVITYNGTNLISASGGGGSVTLDDEQTLTNKTLSGVTFSSTTHACEGDNADVYELRKIHAYSSVYGMSPVVLQTISLPSGKGVLLTITVVSGTAAFAIGNWLYRNTGFIGNSPANSAADPPVIVHSGNKDVIEFVSISVDGTNVVISSGRPSAGSVGTGTYLIAVDIKCLFTVA